MRSIYVGTSGYNYSHWKNKFYPNKVPVKKWLEYYSRHFNTVEINATFYGHFKRSVFESWRDRTPKDFQFTLKGPRFITHIKKLVNVEDSLKYFSDSAIGLKSKLSVVLWQFPPSFKLIDENFEKLEEFTFILPKMYHVFEFRNASWFDDRVYKLMNDRGVGFVINDSSRWPQIEKITGNIVYFRLHGPQRFYGSSYSTEQLKTLAEKIKRYSKQKDVYCYFDNDGQAFAIKNALKLKSMI